MHTGSVGKSPLSFKDLLSSLPEGSRVLDLGCGGGTFNYSQFPGLRIDAIDQSVHEKVKDFPPHARFVQGVASAIPEPDNSFDVVVVNFAYEHFPDSTKALREIDRVTRDGGRVWISMPNAGSFEDQLYRNLTAGGGHLQRPSFERFLRQAYESTSLKLLSYVELPAGFTFLGESEELRHLTWAIVDALRRTVGIDARTRSGYIFVLQKFSSFGPGFLEHMRCCSVCGSPDETVQGWVGGESAGAPWTCSICGARNTYPASLQMVHLDEVERALRLRWERYPQTCPEKLREMMEERTRWAQELEREVTAQRKHAQELQEEFDARGRWGQELDRELGKARDQVATLQQEIERLQSERELLLSSLRLYLKHLWRKHFH